jgi:hypothetical protein
MFNKQSLVKMTNLVKSKLSFMDLDNNRKYEFSKELVSFSAHSIATTSRKFYITYLVLGVFIFISVFYSLLYFIKPMKEVNYLKISRDNFIGLDDKPSKEDIKFKLNTPVAVKWNNDYYFFNTPNSKGEYDVNLTKKEGLHKFYFYAYESSMFNKAISERPVLVTKEYDFTKPSMTNLNISSKFLEKNGTWSFESDEEAPIIKMMIASQETVVYNPTANYNDNPCKQEKQSKTIKYVCPINFSKEESITFSAKMSDKVNNEVDIVSNKVVAYVEPLKVECSQPPSKVRTDTVSVKCKSNRATTYTINKNASDTIDKDVDKVITFSLDPAQPVNKEFDFTLSFIDPNGGTKDLSYKFSRDNVPPSLEFAPAITKDGNTFTLSNSIKNSNERAKIDVNFDQAVSPNSTWYYKYPAGNTFTMEANGGSSITNISSEFRLCTKDPISNSETCANNFIPGFVYYNFKAADDLGNASSYLCTFELSYSPSARCAKY